MTRARLSFAMSVLLALIAVCGSALVTLAITEHGRNQSIRASRAGCLRTSSRNVLFADIFRADAEANQSVATDPRQPKHTQRVRAAEAKIERHVLVRLDAQIDPRAIGELNPVGRGIIRRLGANAFSCDRAFPLSGLLP